MLIWEATLAQKNTNLLLVYSDKYFRVPFREQFYLKYGYPAPSISQIYLDRPNSYTTDFVNNNFWETYIIFVNCSVQ